MRRGWILCLTLFLGFACGGSQPIDAGAPDAGAVDATLEDVSEGMPDAGDDAAGIDALVADVAPTDAPAAPELEIGRCAKPDGEDCFGDVADGRFQRYEPAAEVPMVIGFQGSPMFVFAIRTDGVYPGDPERPAGSESPLIEIDVLDEGRVVASYRDRVALTERDGRLVGLSYFVVVDATPSDLEDRPLEAQVYLEDRDGVRQSATLPFHARLTF